MPSGADDQRLPLIDGVMHDLTGRFNRTEIEDSVGARDAFCQVIMASHNSGYLNALLHCGSENGPAGPSAPTNESDF